jgi:hypothetical protein
VSLLPRLPMARSRGWDAPQQARQARLRLPPGAVGLPVAGVVSDGPGTVLRVRVEVAISRTHSRSTAIRLAGAGRHQ